AHAPGEFTVRFLRLRRDQMIDAELTRNRSRDEAVGGRDDRARITLVAVHEVARLACDDRQDAVAQELAMPLVQYLARMTRQRLQLKIQKLVNVERARFVLFEERLIARLVDFAVEHPFVNQELSPLEIAVASEQRIIEVEQCEAHKGAAATLRRGKATSGG